MSGMYDKHQTSPQWSSQRNFTHGVAKHGSLLNVTLNYFLFTPLVATGVGPRLDPDTPKLPLLCFLHGYRDKPRPEALGIFTDAGHQRRLPLYVLRPGSAKTSNWAPSLRPSSSSHSSRLSPQQNVLLALLDRLLGELPVDPRLLVLAGASMGGYATWDLLVRAPAIFAVGIPMSGGGDTKRANLITARVWAFHSRADRSVPVGASRAMVNAVAAARNVLPNGAPAAVGGERSPARWCCRLVLPRGALPNASSATKGGHEGWTTDVAVGLRYTELLHATHNFCGVPMFDKGLAVPLFEWTLEQLRAAGFGRHRALRGLHKSG